VDYRYDRRDDDDVTTVDIPVKSIIVEANLKATDRLFLFGDYERNLEDNLSIRTGLGFTYTARCWSIDFRYTDRSNDQEFEFKINLHGLGGIGF
jgi:lipopolysaccharide assembly outer membrane protein LptD (OstA)